MMLAVRDLLRMSNATLLVGHPLSVLILQDENGDKVTWGGDGTPNEDIWGPNGWCEAERPNIT